MPSQFQAISPVTGLPLEGTYAAASSAEVDRACRLAAEAFEPYAGTSDAARAAFLRDVASSVAALGDALVDMASAETGLAKPRVAGERDRTVFTLRAFAQATEEGAWRRRLDEPAQPDRTPLPKPSLRRELVPLGPVAVFGASNFPLAYSTAGGDTASALAAGCPVIVKGHALHPGTGAMVASVVTAAVRRAGLHEGTFSLLPAGGDRDQAVGREIVLHPAVKAVGFTGSHGGGMALHHLAQSRSEPVPVFAEMGSVNPVFVLANALTEQVESLARTLVASFTNSNGQMCTCPGLVFVPEGDAAERFIASMAAAVSQAPAMPMLSRRMRDSFRERVAACERVPGVERVAGGESADAPGAMQSPVLLRTPAAAFDAATTLRDECFGPSTLVVTCRDAHEMATIARRLPGTLAASIFHLPSDGSLAMSVHSALLTHAGRIVHNGVPTGVEVSAAMVHGGPYPATNQPHSTAVGLLAMERWCRPVCLQNLPAGW